MTGAAGATREGRFAHVRWALMFGNFVILRAVPRRTGLSRA
jgi:hypothetical protein